MLPLLVALLTPAADQPLTLTPPAAEVGRYHLLEFSLAAPADPGGDLAVAVTTPAGRQVTVPAFPYQPYERARRDGRDWFYPSGPPAWKARFLPTEVGRHQAAAVLAAKTGTKRSPAVAFTCVPSDRHGPIRVSRADTRFLAHDDGVPFFAIGQNLAFVGDDQFFSLSRAEDAFHKLADNGANFLRLWACCEDWAMAIEANKSAWGRSWSGRLPLAPHPDAPAKKAVLLTPDGRDRLEVSPPHRVALRPATRYVLSGRARTDSNTSLHVELARAPRGEPISSSAAGGWTDFRREFTTGPNDYWLGPLALRRDGPGRAWLDRLSLKEAAGGPELLGDADPDRPVRGFYHPLDSFLLDQLLAAADRHGLYIQICLMTRDLYMPALKDPNSPAYAQAIADAKVLFRYAVARWSAYPSLAAWEYFNEIDPGLPLDRFYDEMGTYISAIDPNRHPITTSSWGPSPRDCQHPRLDLAQLHYYYRPADHGRLRDEVDAVLDRARWLRTHAPARPAMLAEFGLADDKWRLPEAIDKNPDLADLHNGLWASALSGLSGTVLPWWWERIDRRDGYRFYRPLSRFLADIPWTSGLHPARVTVPRADIRAVGLQGKDRADLWLFAADAAYARAVAAAQPPRPVEALTLTLDGLPTGDYRIQWWDTREGKVIREDRAAPADGTLKLPVPTFTRDLACKVLRQARVPE